MPSSTGLYYFSHETENLQKKRPPVILIHGAGGNHLSWPPQIRRLADERIYAIDLPSHGRSEGLARHSIDEYANDVLAFMKELKIRSAVIFGISMGSAIALMLALKYPKKILGLALIGSGAKMRVSPKILEIAGNQDTFEAAVEMINKNCFSVNAPQSLIELSKRYMMEMRPSALLADLLACNEFNITERLAEIKQPTLIVCGSEDKMTPLKSSEALNDGITGSHLQVIQKVGHLAVLEQPELTAHILKQFLDSLPLRS